MSKQLVNRASVINHVYPKNYTGAVGAPAAMISMAHYNHACFIITSGAWAGGTAAVTMVQATDIAGATNKALGIARMWTDTATSGTFVETAVASDTFTIGTANKTWIIEVDASQLDSKGGYECLQIAVASPSSNADYYAVTAILDEPRFEYVGKPTGVTLNA
jgi:hypothetical protein